MFNLEFSLNGFEKKISHQSCFHLEDAIMLHLIVTTGQSSVNFLFNFVEQSEGGDITPKDNRPFIGMITSFFL